MGIKKKDQKNSTPILPGPFDDLVQKAFTEQFLSSKYDDMFKETKAEVLGYIEGSDDIEITEGEGFKTEYGSIILSSRTNIKIDKERLGEMVSNGELSIDQLLACVSTFKNEDLEKTLSSSVFNDIAEKTSSQTFTFRATGEFKQQCEREFTPAEKASAPAPKVSAPVKRAQAVIEAKPKIEDAKSKALAAKAAVAKAKSKLKSADDDLDAILGKKGK